MLALYFSAMKPVLEGHGGTIEKYIGDAIMAVFGLPRMHEDDAQRAVRAAARMREALAELNVTLRAEFGVTLENRTGVNTGEVVTGDTGTSQRLATGDTVNVAARLEQAAPAGEVLIGESTYRLVREAVEVVPVEPLTLKGKPEPVPAYRLLSVAEGATSTRPADLPLVGRAREIAALDAEFRRSVAGSECRLVDAARRGRGRQEPAYRGVRAEHRRRGGGAAEPLPVLRRRHHVLAAGRGVPAGGRDRAGGRRGGRPRQARVPLRRAAGRRDQPHRVGHGPLGAAVRKGRAVLGRAGGPSGAGAPQAAGGGLRRHPLGRAHLPRFHRATPRRLAWGAAPPCLRGPP